jgi:hypothetical protein
VSGMFISSISDMFISSRTIIRTRALALSITSEKEGRRGECGGDRDSSLTNANVSKET